MQYRKIIVAKATEFKIDPLLVAAVVLKESEGLVKRPRYEGHFLYTWEVEENARRQRISKDTELHLQKFSWGIMQVMGGTARWRGYKGYLPDLDDPHIGVHWGCLHLAGLLVKYGNVKPAIAAYNAGSVRFDENDKSKYENQSYVDDVMKLYNEIKGVTNAGI